LNASIGLKNVNFHISENFPEIAWRVFKAARRPIPICTILGSWRRNRLAAHTWPPGDAWGISIFLGLDKAPGSG